MLGATYEKLNYKELAVKYFCKAKEILGVNKTIEGLELKTLKYYKELCDRVAALAGARKKGGIGKILGTLLGLALLGGAIWYLFFSPNAPFKKKKEEAPGPVGDYTSITVKLEVEYSGKNSKGNRKLYVDSQLKNNNSFLYPQPANDLTCTGTTKKENKSWQLTTTNKKLEITQEYNNWDYFSYGIGTNRKVLCATYTMSVVKYTFSGGSDPGSPTISGLDQLDINVNQDCTAVSQRVHNCEISADITFAKPANTKDAQQSSTVTVTSFRESR